MVNYTVYAPVGGGRHTVDVLVANCCSSITPRPGTVIEAATLTVEGP